MCDGGCSDPNNFAPIPILIAVPIVLYVVYLLAVKVCAAEGYRHSNLSCVWCTLLLIVSHSPTGTDIVYLRMRQHVSLLASLLAAPALLCMVAVLHVIGGPEHEPTQAKPRARRGRAHSQGARVGRKVVACIWLTLLSPGTACY